MRTTAVLVILLLVVGLNLGAYGALAGDHAVIQPLPTTCQPVSDVELSRMRGTRLPPQFWLFAPLQNTAHRAIKCNIDDISKVPLRFRLPDRDGGRGEMEHYRAGWGNLAELIYRAGQGTPGD